MKSLNVRDINAWKCGDSASVYVCMQSRVGRTERWKRTAIDTVVRGQVGHRRAQQTVSTVLSFIGKNTSHVMLSVCLSVCLSVTLLSVITADMIKLVALAPCSLSDEITTILDKSAWRPELEAWIKYSLQQNEQFVISCQFVQTWLCLQTIQDMDTDTVVMIKR